MNNQINTNTQYCNKPNVWFIDNWNLFGAWDLVIGN